MENLPPIPIPPAQKWREFKVNRVPVIIYLITLTAVVLVWQQSVTPHHYVGEASAASARITSPLTGSLAELKVTRYQEVLAGDPVARIVTTNPEILAASLAVIQAEIDLIRSGIAPDLDQRQNAMRYEQLRLDWMRQRVDLATARINLSRAESELRRNRALYESMVVSEEQLELVEATRDALQAEIEETSSLVQSIEERLAQLKPPEATYEANAAQNSLQAAIAVQEKNLRLAEAEMMPITLRAPISGQIDTIYRQEGEVVSAGEPIAAITGTEASHIMTYLAQPLPLEPKPGMEVEIRSRGGVNPAMARTTVLHVGAQFQTATNSLDPAQPALSKQLPVMINIPAGLAFRPGELVNVNFLK